MKYLKNGKAVEVVSVLPDGQGFVVRDYFETFGDVDGERVFVLDDRVYIVKRVFDKAPTELIDSQYDESVKRLAEIMTKICEARNELRIVEQERKSVLSKLEQMPALRRLEDWIDGKVTHFVTMNYGHVTVLTKDEMKCDSGRSNRWDRRPANLKLITLFGDSEGNLMWEANKYSDGSSSSSVACWMCCSEHEARVLAAQVIDHELSAKEVAWRGNLIQSADKIGHPIDQKHRDIEIEGHRSKLLTDLDRKKKELAEVEKQLLALNST